MYGPISKDGPAPEFGEVGEEIKDEVRRQAFEKIAERAKGNLDADDPFWSKENQEHLARAIDELDDGGGEGHGLIE